MINFNVDNNGQHISLKKDPSGILSDKQEELLVHWILKNNDFTVNTE